jgi:hypothetical protein
MRWLRPLALLSTRGPYRRFIRATTRPEQEYARLWHETKVELMNGSYWPKQFGAKLRGARLEDFPISEYEQYSGVLQQDFASATVSTLSGRAIVFWAESSGTTGHRKVFPITEPYRRQFMATNPPLVHGLLQRFAGALKQPIIYFAAPQPTETSARGIPVTYISAYNYAHLSPLLRSAYAFPLAVMKDGATFGRYGRLYALATDLSAAFAITPARVAAFFEDIERNAEEDLQYLSGKRALPAGLPPLAVSKQRLSLLEAALATRPVDARALWPGLQYVCSWTSAICGLQARGLARWVHDIPVVDATFSATEGWVNVPLTSERSGGPVHTGALITEYLRVGDPVEANRLLPVWALEPGNDYEIVLTNKMGLVRYRLKDILRCTGHYNRSPIVEFVAKAGNELSLGLIRITEEELVGAVAESSVPIAGKWIFGPHPSGDRLLLHVERPIDTEGLARSVHEQLCAKSRFYKRDVGAGVVKTLVAEVRGPDHRFFSAPAHAQTKPKAFTTEGA